MRVYLQVSCNNPNELGCRKYFAVNEGYGKDEARVHVEELVDEFRDSEYIQKYGFAENEDYKGYAMLINDDDDWEKCWCKPDHIAAGRILYHMDIATYTGVRRSLLWGIKVCRTLLKHGLRALERWCFHLRRTAEVK